MGEKIPGLYGALAGRYDLHTPPSRYRPIYEVLLEELGRWGPRARVLDVGCGAGSLVRFLRDAGLDAWGIDLSPEMIARAEERLGPGAARAQRFQDLEEREAYEALLSLSFPFNYCADVEEARAALVGFYRALRPGGLLVLQVMHGPNAPPWLIEEWHPGPGGERDVQFLSRFLRDPAEPLQVRVQYVYSCRSVNELFFEEHVLNVADAQRVAELLGEAGFSDVRIWDDSRRGPLARSPAPYVLGVRPG